MLRTLDPLFSSILFHGDISPRFFSFLCTLTAILSLVVLSLIFSLIVSLSTPPPPLRDPSLPLHYHYFVVSLSLSRPPLPHLHLSLHHFLFSIVCLASLKRLPVISWPPPLIAFSPSARSLPLSVAQLPLSVASLSLAAWRGFVPSIRTTALLVSYAWLFFIGWLLRLLKCDSRLYGCFFSCFCCMNWDVKFVSSYGLVVGILFLILSLYSPW